MNYLNIICIKAIPMLFNASGKTDICVQIPGQTTEEIWLSTVTRYLYFITFNLFVEATSGTSVCQYHICWQGSFNTALYNWEATCVFDRSKWSTLFRNGWQCPRLFNSAGDSTPLWYQWQDGGALLMLTAARQSFGLDAALPSWNMAPGQTVKGAARAKFTRAR